MTSPSADAPSGPPGTGLLIPRLSALMGLQAMSMGIWAVTFPTYLGAHTGDQGRALFGESFVGLAGTAGAIGALFAPALFGTIADRWVNTEWLLVLLNLACAVSLAALCFSTSQTTFYLLLLVYFNANTPSAALASSLALHQLPNPSVQFYQVRATGTVGWMFSGWFIGFVWPAVAGDSIEATLLPVQMGIVLHVVTAAYCLTLPSTPPMVGSLKKELAGGGLLWRNKAIVLFLLISVLATTSAQFYNGFSNLCLNQIGFSHAAGWLTMGQGSELAFMLMAPMLLRRASLKRLIFLGIVAWAARFTLLAFADGSDSAWEVYLAIGLHGPAFVLVFILGQIYVDRLAPPRLRGAAQGWHTVATFGIGALLGGVLSGWGQAWWLTPEGVSQPPYDWSAFWLFPAGISLAAAVAFAMAFREHEGENPIRNSS